MLSSHRCGQNERSILVYLGVRGGKSDASRSGRVAASAASTASAGATTSTANRNANQAGRAESDREAVTLVSAWPNEEKHSG